MRKAFLTALATTTFCACVDDAYDLSDISLKMTLGADGLTLPLGGIEDRTVESLVEDKKIDDLVTEDGAYAYLLDSTIFETIDAIAIDPIRNVIPEIDPYLFTFTEASLPESFEVKGVENRATVVLPSLRFGDKPLDGVSVSNPLPLDNYTGTALPAGTPIPLPALDERAQIAFTVDDVPSEIGAVRRLWFGGSDSGTPIRVGFSLGALAASVGEGVVSFELTFPASYGLRIGDSYGGTATLSGNTLRVDGYRMTANRADFVFYLVDRTVIEPVEGGVLAIDDEIRYTFAYSGISNGTRVPAGDRPLFSLEIAPAIADAELVTNEIVPEPTTSLFDVPIEVNGLDAVSRVDYVAFTEDASNVLVLQTSHSDIPLRGTIPVQVHFPETYVFAAGTEGLVGQILTTTLDRLSANGGVRLRLEGIRFDESEAMVNNGVLTSNRQVRAIVAPDFPADTYRMSEVAIGGDVQIDIRMQDTELRIDPQQCEMVVGFLEEVDIVQEIGETFAVPDEVGAISFAAVCDANYGTAATAVVSIGFDNLPVGELSFDNIDIVLPDFLRAEHEGYDPQTHTVHIDRVDYAGGKTVVARIKILGVENVPVRSGVVGKVAELAGSIRITATLNVPDGTLMDGIPLDEIVLRPEVSLPPLAVTHMTGTVDLDLKEYLEPTTIDLSDIRESLGDQNIELNLVAPQIALNVSNPVGVAMVGDIVLQPYDFSDRKLEPIVVSDVRIEPAVEEEPRITKLYVTDGNAAPEGYTLCRVENLSSLVKILPSKIDVEFDFQVDDTEPQRIAITGEDYPLDVQYSIRIPLEFKSNATIDYTDTEDVDDAFDDIDDYEITAEDILIQLDARSTLPLDLNLSAEFLDANDKVLRELTATVDGRIDGFDPASDGAYRESQAFIRVDLRDGDVRHLQKVAKIRYRFQGKAVGAKAALKPDQYFSASMKLILKKGITFDLDDLLSDSDSSDK